jgi:two-component system nitrogen regulation sensor histidine kinase NtrY
VTEVLPAPPVPSSRPLTGWATRIGLGRKAAFALTLASILSGLLTYFLLTRASPIGPDSRTVVALLTVNLVLLLLFGAMVANQLVQLWAERRRGLAGSRLHIRLVILFSLVAMTPTIVFLILSYLLVSVGMQSWFSEKVRTAVSESRAVAQAYQEEHEKTIRNDAIRMADDISVYALKVIGSEDELDNLLDREVWLRSLTEAEVVEIDGVSPRVLGRSSLSLALDVEPLPSEAISTLRGGPYAPDSVIITGANEVRALVKINGLPNAVLYVGRPIEPRVLNHVKLTNEVVDQYERLETQRSSYQISFMLIFAAVALLLLLAAIWVGFNFASQISRRIIGLVVAAEAVRGGDLSARAEESGENDEFRTLSRAFNRMTEQLESQRSDLVEANLQLDLRRRFTEAVLSGVSAGVLGLDAAGVIHLPNRSAATLLGVGVEELMGQTLASVAPEMAPLIEEALNNPDQLVEGQIRVLSRGRAMVLLVRIAAQHGETGTGEFVVTFDDITELLSAQRKAAWADVARRIAHEMKNPLTPIQLSAERLKRKYLKEITTDPDTFEMCTDTIIRQVGDIGRMVDEFSSFARMPAPSMKPENLIEITRQAVFLQRAAHPDIAFELAVPAERVEVGCDSRQISQALINLLQNAIDSIHARQVGEAGGTGMPGRIEVSLEASGGKIALAVEDNGKGLPKDGRERLTEPYVTTRAKGTGLGLAIVKKIMEDHGGELILRDGVAGGASVSLLFPAALARRAPSRGGQRLTETVLHGG